MRIIQKPILSGFINVVFYIENFEIFRIELFKYTIDLFIYYIYFCNPMTAVNYLPEGRVREGHGWRGASGEA